MADTTESIPPPAVAQDATTHTTELEQTQPFQSSAANSHKMIMAEIKSISDITIIQSDPSFGALLTKMRKKEKEMGLLEQQTVRLVRLVRGILRSDKAPLEESKLRKGNTPSFMSASGVDVSNTSDSDAAPTCVSAPSSSSSFSRFNRLMCKARSMITHEEWYQFNTEYSNIATQFIQLLITLTQQVTDPDVQDLEKRVIATIQNRFIVQIENMIKQVRLGRDADDRQIKGENKRWVREATEERTRLLDLLDKVQNDTQDPSEPSWPTEEDIQSKLDALLMHPTHSATTRISRERAQMEFDQKMYTLNQSLNWLRNKSAKAGTLQRQTKEIITKANNLIDHLGRKAVIKALARAQEERKGKGNDKGKGEAKGKSEDKDEEPEAVFLLVRKTSTKSSDEA